MMAMPSPPAPVRAAAMPGPPASAPPSARSGTPIFSAIRNLFSARTQPTKPAKADIPPASAPEPEDLLMDLAQQLEPDGGMPGKNDFERMVRSLVAVLALLIEGHTPTAGAFRNHAQRLMRFLETSAFPSLNTRDRRTLNDALAWIKKGVAPPWKIGDLMAFKEKEAWDRITKLVTSAY